MKKQYLDYAGLKRVLKHLLPGARKIWHGTLDEWKTLSEAERDKYDQAEVIDIETTADLTLLGAVQGFLTTPTSSHWLLADGSAVNATLHPRLAEIMPVLPDLRECVLVGVGQNTKNTIAAHDVYNVGQFKDDQLQGHNHRIGTDGNGGGYSLNPNSGNQSGGSGYRNNTGIIVSDGTNGTPRTGTTTHGKQTGVLFYVWAD